MSSDMTIVEFCDTHGACHEGREWALANCATMADVWATAKPGWLVWVATRRHVLSDTELRLFAAWAARQVQHLMADPRSLAALEVAERYARGEASDEELDAAYDAACDAYDAARAAYDAANAAFFAALAAGNAAGKVAGDRAYDAAHDAAYAACAAADADARDAAYAACAAARDAYAAADAADANAACDAACAAAYADQAAWLRENTKPDFSRGGET